MKTYLKNIFLFKILTSIINYSVVSGAFRSVINMQLAKIVSITNVLKIECVNTRIAKRRIQFHGCNIKKARVALNRNIVLLRLTTTKI